MEKKACIFDMDGTLVDSMGYWHQLQVEYLAAKGVGHELREEVIVLAKPLSLLESAELFIKRCGLTGTPEHATEEMREMMAEHYRRDVIAKAGVTDYLTALKKTGAKLCVASATDRPLVESCLRRLGLDGYFDFFLSCAEVGAGKDQPTVFLEAARRLGTALEQTVVFEDSLPAGRTAKRAGFSLVAIYDEDGAEDWAALSAIADETVTDWAAAAKRL